MKLPLLDIPFPWIWPDVALVHLACGVPLALMLVSTFRPRRNSAASILMVLSLLTVGILPWLGGIVASSPLPRLALRSLPALALMSGVLLAVNAVWVGRETRCGTGSLLAGTLFWLLVPVIYLEARYRHDAARVRDLLEQSRLGEAHALLRAWSRFERERIHKDRQLAEISGEVERIVADLESLVDRPPSTDRTPRERLERARRLAMLGRTEKALEVIASLGDAALLPDAENLRGTIHETAGDWQLALESFRRAHVAWQREPESEARSAGSSQARTGIAYAQRKSGRYAEAEATYRQLLAEHPSAEKHFLLAQFYEDAQDALHCRLHARRAMELDSSYVERGNKLIRKLAVYHFGCLGVLRAEMDQARSGR